VKDTLRQAALGGPTLFTEEAVNIAIEAKVKSDKCPKSNRINLLPLLPGKCPTRIRTKGTLMVIGTELRCIVTKNAALANHTFWGKGGRTTPPMTPSSLKRIGKIRKGRVGEGMVIEGASRTMSSIGIDSPPASETGQVPAEVSC
jgi:hypothetical protein